jgi:hypothetical protein
MFTMKLNVQFDKNAFKENSQAYLEAIDEGMDDLIDFVADRSTTILDSGMFQGIGNLKRSQEIEYNWLHKILWFHAPYAEYVEYGTGIYSEKEGAPKEPIYPKKAKVLAWVTDGMRPGPDDKEGWREAKREGRAVFAKKVWGMEARPFVRPAMEEAVSRASDFFNVKLKRLH